MKLIGITGKPGAGKTTISNMLAEHKDVGVIHVDELVDEVKLKYFKFLMKENADGKKVKLDPKLKKALLQNRFLLSLAMRFRARTLKRALETRIADLQKEGKQAILIDDWFLKYLSIYKDLSFIILMERPFVQRSNSVIERDKVTKEEVVIGDLGLRTGNYRKFLRSAKLVKINNNLTKAELRERCEQLYKERISKGEKTPENKWKVEGIEFKPVPINQKQEQRKDVRGDEEYYE